MAAREWKTDGEIRTIVHEESKEWRDEVRAFQDKQDTLANQLVNGAQAAMNTAMILTGDTRFHIKGALPEITDRLSALEARAEHTEMVGDERHKQNSLRLDGLEKGQGRLTKSITKLWGLVAHDKDGKVDYTRVGVVIGGIMTAGHFVLNHIPTWFEFRKFCVQVMTQAGK